jgi:dTDP-4-amino-4,6-dideoxygalactose transaminase
MTTDGKIPFVDLVVLHRAMEEELISIFRRAVETAGFIGGAMVEEFEREFARFCRTEYCVGVGSGTDALRFALVAAGVSPGDVVVTACNTFIATTEAISQIGARPDFVDIDERTYNLSPDRLREYLETRCRPDPTSNRTLHRKTGRPVTAIVPVHLYGQMADMDPILDLAEQYNLIVIEDACQAHGAEYLSERRNGWKRAGSLGRAAAFSFYPTKNLGACGEAGAVTTDDQEIARKVRMLRDHGQARKYYHEVEGYNGRLDAIQAGVLVAKLRHLPEWNDTRRENATRYNELFRTAGGALATPYEPSWARAVYHLYVIRAGNRDGLRTHLEGAGIATGIHYPLPLHLQNAYRVFGYKAGDFPISERVASEILSLPMYPQLQRAQQERIAQEILEYVSTRPSESAVPIIKEDLSIPPFRPAPSVRVETA